MKNQQLSSINVLGEGFVVDGVRMTIPTQCVVSGTIFQHVECLGKLVLNKSAIIGGNIKAADLVLKGWYEGSIWVKGVVTLTSTARFRGKISASKLIIEEGAFCHSDLLIDSEAVSRYESVRLKEELPHFNKRISEPLEDPSDDSKKQEEDKSVSKKEKKRAKNLQKESSEEVTDEIEMDRSDAPGKVADHFW